MKYRPWEEWQVLHLESRWHTRPPYSIAKKVGRTIRSVMAKAESMGLGPPWRSGAMVTMNEAAKLLGVSPSLAKKICVYSGVRFACGSRRKPRGNYKVAERTAVEAAGHAWFLTENAAQAARRIGIGIRALTLRVRFSEAVKKGREWRMLPEEWDKINSDPTCLLFARDIVASRCAKYREKVRSSERG
jgi:hypothetical protein